MYFRILGSSIYLFSIPNFFSRILGYHSTLCTANTQGARFRTLIAYLFPTIFVDESMQEQFTKQFTEFYFLEGGFFHIQATKPDTAGKNDFILIYLLKIYFFFKNVIT